MFTDTNCAGKLAKAMTRSLIRLLNWLGRQGVTSTLPAASIRYARRWIIAKTNSLADRWLPARSFPINDIL